MDGLALGISGENSSFSIAPYLAMVIFGLVGAAFIISTAFAADGEAASKKRRKDREPRSHITYEHDWPSGD